MIPVDWLGDSFPTFPEFERMLREYEAELRQNAPPPSTPTYTYHLASFVLPPINIYIDPPTTCWFTTTKEGYGFTFRCQSLPSGVILVETAYGRTIWP